MLFKTTQKLADYADINTSGTNFASLRPTLRVVEENHIIPILGSELYKILNDAYTAPADESALTNDQKNLLDKCRQVIGPYLCYYYAPKSEVKLSDSGLTRLETANTKSAWQYQGTNYREAMLREAETGSEKLLEFLDDNKSAFPQWLNSYAFQDYKSLFIKSGKEFQQLFPSHTPYRNYHAMRPKMHDVEEITIKTAIGKNLYATLKQKDAAATTTANEKELIKLLKKAIACYTVATSIPFLAVRIDANGITVMNQAGASKDDDAKRTAAGAALLNPIIDRCNTDGKTWLQNAIAYIYDNLSFFPDALTIAVVVEEESINAALRGTFGLY